MSSFIRKSGVSAAELGTRPGPAGQSLISAGHADIDRLLGGGLPLGSLAIILEDGWSQHHVTLLRYFLGEGAACRHQMLLAAAKEPENGATGFLPKLVDPAASAAEKEREKQAARQEEEVQLKIAWQYGRYLKPQQGSSTGGLGAVSTGSGTLQLSGGGRGLGQRPPNRPAGRDWCHSFDISKSAAAAPSSASSDGLGGDANNPSLACSVVNGANSREELVLAAAAFVESLKKQPAGQPQSVGRLGVLSLGSCDWGMGVGTVDGRRSVVQTLLQLKAVVRDTKCCAVVTVPAVLHNDSDITRMSHIADAVLALEAVQDDADIVRLAPDPQSVAGLLVIRKLPAIGFVAAPAPQNPLHIVRYRRKKLSITPVEIDPDAEEADAAAKSSIGGGGGSAATPAAKLLCGGPAKGKPDLEF